MSEAQLGLVVVAVLVIGFAIAMRVMGALRTAGTVTAIATVCAIAAALFFTQ